MTSETVKEAPQDLFEPNQVVSTLLFTRTFDFSCSHKYCELYSGSSLSISAPTGYPRNLRISAVTNTSADATWQPVEESKRNSEISGYVLQYTNTDTGETYSKSVNSPTTLETKIR